MELDLNFDIFGIDIPKSYFKGFIVKLAENVEKLTYLQKLEISAV